MPDTETTVVARRPPGERLREELRDYAVVAAYLYICLGAIVLYKAAVLRGAGVEYFPVGFAAIKALILGKFVLLGKAAGVGERFTTSTVLGRIARKSLAFLVLLIVLSVLEELAGGWWRGRSVAQTVAEFSTDPALQVLADSLLLLLVLVPLVATVEVSRALGPGVLARTLRN